MKLSQGVEWGLHCVTLLGLAPASASVRRDTLAGHYGLPETVLAKHLQAMARAGLLHAVTGPKGGYRLARPVAAITVLDVVEAIEGSAAPFVCQEIRQRGAGALTTRQCREPCAIYAVMNEADQAWRASLRSVTVANLLDRLPPGIRERNQSLLAEAVS
ncbi:Rrf2 family transcriptional regulator [Amycolatopsis rubida]|uniref:Rrf2 family protein n=1 Tax=Amycolatopsis rubida TaxID=112413 RepID=A0A1I5VER4_9PSEU|nr:MULTISPECIES: Rrf2 family transcriptional regulator [Amycolatopsis]MYW89349.1 Rrf2 family transcriptional regulator [Amycolatopsis rubida]NEC54327.1 Rrf2 family transcriptional regulator [Amycolatopsis rubida]OAP21101.1 HTH-type transcriptional repressor NsrR [Amycolatopsis sp. M39]SFQ05881.1 Rrf2 family protein [Amycolatopsis rubida]